VNQGFGPDGPQGDLENRESYEIKQIKKEIHLHKNDSFFA
jgi:hypothetical protein